MSEVRKLLRRIQEFEKGITKHADRCEREARRLKAGFCPSDSLIEGLKDVSQWFRLLREDVLAQLPEPPKESPGSIREMKELLEQRRELERGRREKVERIRVLLRKVKRIRAREGDRPELEELRARIDGLLEYLETAPMKLTAEVEGIATGDAPLLDLLRLVEEAESLHFEVFERLRKRVDEAIGTPLAVAAIRGQLYLGAEEESEAPGADASEVEEAPTTTPQEEPEPPEDPEPPEAEPEQDASSDVEPVQPIQVGSTPVESTPVETREEETESREPDGLRSVARTTIWKLIRKGRVALASHIARGLQAEDADPGLPPASLLEAVALAPRLQRPGGALAGALRARYEELQVDDDDATGQLLLWAASLRPSLVAPGTGAALHLDKVVWPEGVSKLFELTRAVAETSYQLSGLDALALKGVKGNATWHHDVETVNREVEDWLEQAPRMTIVYAPATEVWRHLTRPGGRIHGMLAPALGEEPGKSTVVRAAVDLLSDPGQIRKLVRMTERDVLRRLKGKHIHSRALQALQARIAQAVALAEGWLEVMDRRPEIQPWLRRILDEFNEKLDVLREPALAEFEILADRGGAEGAGSAAAAARRALIDVHELFDAEKPHESEESSPGDALTRDLLFTSNLTFDQGGHLEPSSESVLPELLRASRFQADWETAMARRLESGDLHSAERILSLFTGDQEARDEQDVRFDQARKSHVERLKRSLRLTQKEVDLASAYGFIEETERSDYETVIQKYETTIEELKRFDRAQEDLERVIEKIRNLRREELQRLHSAAENLNLPDDSPALRHIMNAIEAKYIHSAREYISRIREGESLDDLDQTQEDAFLEFYPKRLQGIERLLADPSFSPPSLIRQVREKGRLQVRPDRTFKGPDRERIADLLEAWFKVKRTPVEAEDGVRNILEGLGLNIRRMRLEDRSRYYRFEVTVKDIADRRLCQIPHFGSGSRGMYSLICVWDQRSVTELVDLAHWDEDSHRAAIILYFAPLSVRERSELAGLSLKMERPLLVLDEILFLHLCALKGERLPALFRCALPFTFAEPYITAGGIVPPEMFFGRENELRRLMNPQRPHCLVYGGRQLGKTALLRKARRDFHNPDKGRIAIWFDLGTGDFGTARPPEQLWMNLDAEFRRSGVIHKDVLEPNPSVSGRVRRFLGAIRDWLDEDGERRILLLLDEADAFLKEDMRRDFSESRQLKGLMEETSRRFKVVLAGLHDVFRTTVQANQPLAHLGKPINVGPLLANGEWGAARSLVKGPLESLGFRFESEDLVTRILAQTNYFPSLIQVYCSLLLKELRRPAFASALPTKGPPYPITEHHLEKVYRSADLREAIRNRFDLTLHLDQRYEVAANAIALKFRRGDRSAAEGLDLAEVRREVTDWWSDGFEGITELDLECLLDEMVGLGVLRRKGDRFALRNANVLTLMGTREEMENRLVKDREEPLQFDAAVFRARRTTDDLWRHPLTFQQESRLTFQQQPGSDELRYGVALLTGNRAAGIEELMEFQMGQTASDFFERTTAETDFDQFEEQLSALTSRERGGTTLLLVAKETLWDQDWIRAAEDRLTKLFAKDKFVRIAFIADPGRTWKLTPALVKGEVPHERFVLTPWKDALVRQWLQDVNLVAEADPRRKITSVTGNWPVLLIDLIERCGGEFHNYEEHLAALDSDLRDRQARERYLPLFGLDVEEPSAILRMLQGLADDEDIGPVAMELSETELGVEEGQARQCIAWAESLRLVFSAGDRWRIDPVVRKLVAD